MKKYFFFNFLFFFPLNSMYRRFFNYRFFHASDPKINFVRICKARFNEPISPDIIKECIQANEKRKKQTQLFIKPNEDKNMPEVSCWCYYAFYRGPPFNK